MDEAEFAHVFGEALRQLSYEVKNGATSPFRGLLNAGSIDVTVYFNGVSVAVKPLEKPVEENTPVLEAQPEETVVEEETEVKPTRKRKTTV